MRQGAALLALLLTAACATGPVERFTIPPGASLTRVADTLSAHGIIGCRICFKVTARIRGAERSVQAGVYELPRGAGTWRALTALKEGHTLAIHFTVPEGLTLWDLADLAQSELGIPTDSLLIAATDSAAATSLLHEPGFEGFLLPETYDVPSGTRAPDLVRLMAEEFLRRWEPGWTARLDTLQLTRRQVMALAAIVEGEARHDEERPVIAGVYWNRFKAGIALQADPTVQYAIEARTGERKPRLFFKDLDIQSPYNTYLHPGLPPGPINSPGLASIRAALYPEAVPYLYFVAIPDGHHLFSRTLAEHEKAIATARRLRKAQEDSLKRR
ncbi:MAG TPA: endolytic transglycosylase MltG [Gemmatimonadales bacterium]|nr:endolytic transglycosylase MltG [Gemmatimonadales bacterium]